MKCSRCDDDMENGALYLRGFGGSLSWSVNKDVRFLSKKTLEQIHLGKLSITGSANSQAVIDGWRCPKCKIVAFETDDCYMK